MQIPFWISKEQKTSISFGIPSFIGNIQLQSLELHKEGYIQLVKKERSKFWYFLKKMKTQSRKTPIIKTDYAATAYPMISRLLNLVPTDVSIKKRLAFKIDDNGKKQSSISKNLP